MRFGWVGLMVGLTALAACSRGPELRASCGPVAFTEFPAALDEFPPLDDDAQAAFDELVSGETAVEAAGMFPGFEWSIASRDGDELVLFGQVVGPEGVDGGYAQFARVGDRWQPSGWGGCRIDVDAAGLGPASVALDPDRPVDPTSTDLPVLINERACASGRAPVDRDVVPLVTESAASVTVVVLVEPVQGGAECPDNPWHPITIALDAPVGERALFDGGGQTTQPLGLPDGDP